MRVALVTREYPPETAWGGIGSFYAGFARSLVEAGHEVEVFAQGLERESTETGEDRVVVHRVMGLKDGFGAKTGGSLAGNDDLGLFALGLASAMHDAVVDRHIQAPFDLIEGHEHLGINAFINASALIDAVTVTRYHSAYHTLVKRGLVDWPPSRLIEALERAAIAGAGYRISTSRIISDAVADDFGTVAADTVVPNFVKQIDYEGRFAAKKRQILFVGRMVLGHKRPDVAIEAFARFCETHGDYQFVLVGPDQDLAEGGTVWQQVRRRLTPEAARRTRYLGAQPQAEVYRLMAESRAIIVPSDFESFGMVAVEAMQHQCLPFVSSETAMADLVPDPRLVCRRGEAEDFAQRLSSVLSDEAGAADLAERCRSHALEAYSERRVMTDNLRFYGEVLSKPREPLPTRHFPTPTADDPAAEHPLVSIVVPNFNGARFIGETLQSLVSQDYPNLEIIVVDGGSTDDSLAVVRQFPDVILISQPDKGQAHAINRGLLRARGDILAYLNSDDVYRPGAIREVVQHFRASPQARILVGACDYIDEASRTIGHLKPVYTGAAGIVRYWGWERWHTLPQQSVFWRREVVERVGLFDAGRHFVMDLDYWIRVAQLYDFHLVPQTLAAFRLVSGTKTVSSTDRMYGEELQTFYRYRHLLPAWRRPFETLVANRHYSERMTGFAESLYLDGGFRRRALKTLLVAIKRYPLRALDVRSWLLAANTALTLAGQGGRADRVHRRILGWLWRLRHRR